MPLLSRRALRYCHAWLGRPAPCVETEITMVREGTPIAATVVRASEASRPAPAWVVLHGMTRLGRAHEQLRRFARAVASTGALAVVPEVPEWRRLKLAPHAATSTVRAAIRALREGGWVGDRPIAVVGFSFGAPHGIAAAAEPDLVPEISGVVGFGGYAEVESTFRFMMTGASEAGAPPDDPPPDPYGRWIVGSNCLTAVPGLEDHGDVASALHELAVQAGDLRAPSWDAVYDPVIARLRARVAPGRRDVYDLFAVPCGGLPVRRPADDLSERLARAARTLDPLLDPTARLSGVSCPVHILHGEGDRLISCREADKLRRALPSRTPSDVTVTSLFGHARQEPLSFLRSLRDVPRFARALTRLLELA